jgi:hypothetical protein
MDNGDQLDQPLANPSNNEKCLLKYMSFMLLSIDTLSSTT